MSTLERRREDRGLILQRHATTFLRAALVAIFLPIGLQKFTAYEAAAIERYVANSPFFSWAYEAVGLRATSSAIGVLELLIGAALAVGFLRPGSRIAIAGAIGSVAVFLVTLSFLLTTPGVITLREGLPLLTPTYGQFLVKDMVLLGASALILGSSMTTRSRS